MIATLSSSILHIAASHILEPHFSFPQGGGVTELIMLRWIHLVFGVIWIGHCLAGRKPARSIAEASGQRRVVPGPPRHSLEPPDWACQDWLIPEKAV